MSLELLEPKSIRDISFVPNTTEINQLIRWSSVAEEALINREKGPLLSKLHHLPTSYGLLPESFNPNDTILGN